MSVCGRAQRPRGTIWVLSEPELSVCVRILLLSASDHALIVYMDEKMLGGDGSREVHAENRERALVDAAQNQMNDSMV
jgi:hypothetical protein